MDMKSFSLLIAFFLVSFLTACGSSPKTVPIKVYTEPAGSYVIYRVDSGSEAESPWIYLGTTPLESTFNFDKKANKAKKISIKVMKEGYEVWLKRKGLKERFRINRNFIDFQRIPQTIQNRIWKVYNEYEFPEPENIYPFCKKMGFREYLDEFHKFETMLMRLY